MTEPRDYAAELRALSHEWRSGPPELLLEIADEIERLNAALAAAKGETPP